MALRVTLDLEGTELLNLLEFMEACQKTQSGLTPELYRLYIKLRERFTSAVFEMKVHEFQIHHLQPMGRYKDAEFETAEEEGQEGQTTTVTEEVEAQEEEPPAPTRSFTAKDRRRAHIKRRHNVASYAGRLRRDSELQSEEGSSEEGGEGTTVDRLPIREGRDDDN